MNDNIRSDVIRMVSRAQLITLSQAVERAGGNYGRPHSWMESNIPADSLIPLYTLLAKGTGVLRCIVVPKLTNGRRGAYTIDLAPKDVEALPLLSAAQAQALLREVIEYVPYIPLTPEQQQAWKDAGYQ